MAGFTFGGLFDRDMNFNEDGRLEVENVAEAAAEKTQIIKDENDIGGGSTTIYTVPAGKVLYITSAWLSCVLEGNNKTGGGSIGLDNNNQDLLKSILDTTANTDFEHSEMTVGFGIPVKVEAADNVEVISFTDGDAYAGFTGWLEDA